MESTSTVGVDGAMLAILDCISITPYVSDEKHTRINERGAEGNDLVVLVRDVGDSVDEVDAILFSKSVTWAEREL